MSPAPVVSTTSGPVRGIELANGICVFKGIPYAAPPTGLDRFREPVPPAPWTGVRNAFEYGPTAPKTPYAAPLDALVPEADIAGDDYLNLNIWTPDPAGSAPVLVFLHGGGFSNGSGADGCHDGTNFARDGVVLVTPNYRIGVDGFLLLDGVPANLGLQDQIAALAWVRENIAAFGGDPDRVTLGGQSAGAMSVGALLAMSSASGLFHRAILQSGAAHHTIGTASARMIADALAERLGIATTHAAFAAVPSDKLLAVLPLLRSEIAADPDPDRWGEAALTVMPFQPVVDGSVLPGDPRNAGTGLDLLIGTNSDEFNLFLAPTGLIDLIPDSFFRRAAEQRGLDPDAAQAAYGDAKPGELLARMMTDWTYRIPAVRLAEACTGTAHMYEFCWQSPAFGGRLGACHTAELPFAFDNLHERSFAGLLGTQPPQPIADAMHAAWVAFVTTGDPGWRAYREDTRTTMRFDTLVAEVDDARPAERELWDGVR
jgi:para-nitrobenzyl esterase